jgi:hypothetical protein
MKLPYLIPSQLPEFVTSDYPAFIEFLQAYYKWFEEEYSLGKLEDLIDIDYTIDEFLQYFKKELDVYGVLRNTNDRLYVRNIKQMYAAKGSEASFQFLFKALFGKPSSITYPWDYVFKPSAGLWKQDLSIIVRITKRPDYTGVDPVFLLGGNEITVVDSTNTQYVVNAADIIQRASDVFEIFINRFSYKNSTLVSFTAENGTIEGDILPTTYKARVNRKGYGFEVGQVFSVSSYGGSGSAIKVKRVDEDGGILSVELIDFGYGYESNFAILITPQGAILNTVSGPTVTLTTDSTQLTYPTDDTVAGQYEAGVIVRHDYVADYMQDTSYVGQVAGTFRTQQNVDYSAPDYASIYFEIGSLCRYPGSYVKSDNVLGDFVYIEDSYYYQAFSYVTNVEATVEKYATLLKNSLHPTGTIHFGNYLIQNEFEVVSSIDSVINIYRDRYRLYDDANVTDALSRTIAVSRQLDDTVIPQESVGKHLTKEGFTDSIVVTDVLDRIFVRDFADNISVTDQLGNKSVGKALADTAEVSDTLSRTASLTKSITDTTTVSDSPAKSLTKDVTDTTTVSDTLSRTMSLSRSPTENVSVVDSNPTTTVS